MNPGLGPTALGQQARLDALAYLDDWAKSNPGARAPASATSNRATTVAPQASVTAGGSLSQRGRVAQFTNPLNSLPVENRLTQVRQTLQQKNLEKSFASHANKQLREQGVIRIGVVDNYGPGETHGLNVEARIRANAPAKLQNKIQIVRYDVAGLDRDGVAKVLSRAAADASKKDLVALNIAGGVQPYSVDSIQQWISAELTSSNAGRAADEVSSRAKLTPAERNAWASLSSASYRIPVVTPVWNDGNTTLAALTLARSNGIVTSIDTSSDSQATEVAIVDVRMPAQVGSKKTSQSAPTFIGQALGLVKVP
jgi:hypothetical protein